MQDHRSCRSHCPTASCYRSCFVLHPQFPSRIFSLQIRAHSQMLWKQWEGGASLDPVRGKWEKTLVGYSFQVSTEHQTTLATLLWSLRCLLILLKWTLLTAPLLCRDKMFSSTQTAGSKTLSIPDNIYQSINLLEYSILEILGLMQWSVYSIKIMVSKSPQNLTNYFHPSKCHKILCSLLR